MKIYYMPLEPYQERYTELLTNWTVERWMDRPGVDLVTVHGQKLGEGINVGSVLDAYGRCYWSMTQIGYLVKELRDRPPRSNDVIYFDDMFTPGYEALPYILDQLPVVNRPRIFARNHAQSVDPDDFVFPMRRWMRHFEKLVYQTATGIICASTVHKEMMESAMLDDCPIHVLGLPFDALDVRSRGPAELASFEDRPRQVIYASRFDREKQPHFFMDVVEEARARKLDVSFVVCTGATEMRSNDRSALTRLEALRVAGMVQVQTNLTKNAYYALLANSRVQLNTARQDFISYTAIEASTFKTPTLAPAFRSFPEALRSRADQLYVPWSVEEATDKLSNLLEKGSQYGADYLSFDQNGTLDRILELFQGVS